MNYNLYRYIAFTVFAVVSLGCYLALDSYAQSPDQSFQGVPTKLSGSLLPSTQQTSKPTSNFETFNAPPIHVAATATSQNRPATNRPATNRPAKASYNDENPGLPLGSTGNRKFNGLPPQTNQQLKTNQPTLNQPPMRNAAYRGPQSPYKRQVPSSPYSQPNVRRTSPLDGPPASNSTFNSPSQTRSRNVSTQQSGGGFGTTSQESNRAQQEGQLGNSNVNGNTVEIYPGRVELIDDIEVPALETGQIKKLFVKEGDPVEAGAIVGLINDELFLRMAEQAKLRLAIAKKKSDDNTSIMAAENEIKISKLEYNRTKNLANKGSKSQSEREQTQFSYQLALLKKIAAQNEKDAAYGESRIESSRLKEVEEHIRRHTLTAPAGFNGHVMQILRHPLEWVNAGEPVMRIARMDKLWVQGVVNTDQVNPHEVINRPVTVTLDLARGETTRFEGKIVHVGLERQSSNQVLVKAEILNRAIRGHYVLQPKSTVTMKIHLDEDPATKVGNSKSNSPIIPVKSR